MIAVMILAALVGLAVVYFYRLWVPAAPNLLGQLGRWEQDRRRATSRVEIKTVAVAGVMGRVAQWSAEQLRVRRPATAASFERDLAITGNTTQTWLAKTFTLVLTGFIAPFVLGVLGRIVGIGVSFSVMLVGAFALSTAMALIS